LETLKIKDWTLTTPREGTIWQGRFIRSLLGSVFVLTDAALVIGNHVVPTVHPALAGCPMPNFTMNELYLHGVLGLAAILLIHPQSLRELPAAMKASMPFVGRK
jgi:hypothetical protein